MCRRGTKDDAQIGEAGEIVLTGEKQYQAQIVNLLSLLMCSCESVRQSERVRETGRQTD